MKTIPEDRYDALVMGSGIAGLSYAIRLASSDPDMRIAVLSKTGPQHFNTGLAQGGIAAVAAGDDSFEAHISDTLRAGQGYCNEEVVRMTVRSAPAVIEDLLRWGVRFDQDESGQPDLHREGGHSAGRIWHCKDHTGRVILNALLRTASTFKNIQMLSGFTAMDIISPRDRMECLGLWVTDPGGSRIVPLPAKAVMLAGGGCSALFRNTTNPLSSTGDAVAIAYRAGAEVTDMDLIQFHPTALLTASGGPMPLLTEALRGAGAKIVNDMGERFLFRHDIRGELATRDIISYAICREMKKSGKPHVWLDCRDVREASVRFPTVDRYLAEQGLSASEDLIPVLPAAHFQCGGIRTDISGCSSIPGLYASGECAGTGLHGKNRLASNSLLEALVFSAAAARHTLDTIGERETADQSMMAAPAVSAVHHRNLPRIRNHIREAMSRYCGVIRSLEGLMILQDILRSLQQEFSFHDNVGPDRHGYTETLNMLTVSQLITEHAIDRMDSGETEVYQVNRVDKIKTNETQIR